MANAVALAKNRNSQIYLSLFHFRRTLAAWQKRPLVNLPVGRASPRAAPPMQRWLARTLAPPASLPNPPPSSIPASFIEATIWNSPPSCPTPALTSIKLTRPSTPTATMKSFGLDRRRTYFASEFLTESERVKLSSKIAKTPMKTIKMTLESALRGQQRGKCVGKVYES
jgi:hypothetical protein